MATWIRLTVGGVVVSTVMAYMAFSAASSSWQYYLTVDECLNQADALAKARLRVSGTIARDTLRIAPGRGEATFQLMGTDADLPVTCRGPLPDNLAEAMEVVVEGEMEPAGRLRGERVMTRCASKYRSRDEGQRASGDGELAQADRWSGG